MIEFYKYQGAGNDFILIDDREEVFDRNNNDLVNFLCDRRFGIGADGLMLLRNAEGYDFEMIYYNSDGKEGSMCGNGGRCIVAFANDLKVVGDSCLFIAVDGPHDANIISEKGERWVSLKMIDVDSIENGDDYTFMDTGSPHYVKFENELDQLDIVPVAHGIRYNNRFKDVGTNVNFIDLKEGVLNIRTYERGVEDETLACGTGVTAAVLTAHLNGKFNANTLDVKAKGGNLRVKFDKVDEGYRNIWLEGPAKYVFKGEIDARF